MALTPGTRLGVYEVTAQIGEGGMGQVYRARDTKLNRYVALKLLPDAFASDPDRLARFTREAQTLASLNHPNIAIIHGFEEAHGIQALVMELVEGPTLADRIAQGPMPLDEALPIARQIAEALEAAHDQGIIHRDLKPANVKVRPDGTVKVLDFGLAKALEPVGTAPNMSQSPTITSPALTRMGIILGTAAYMSPEQAAGKAADKRSDLWAFGVVLMEMLTGRPVFTGETVSHVLASVLKSEPEWTTLPAETPTPIRRLLRRCLEKDRKRRLDSATAARLEIEDATTEPPAVVRQGAVAAQRSRLTWVVAAVVTMAAVLLAVPAIRHLRETPVTSPPEMRVDIATPPTTDPASLAISPDGHSVVFAAISEGRSRLWLRSLDSTAVRPLTGAEDGILPFWSQDSRSIGFFADGKLKRVDAAGGAAQTLANASSGRGGAWSGDEILFSPNPGSPILKVSANGGEPVAVTHLQPPQQTGHYTPHFLPDGRHFLYFAIGSPEGAGVYVGDSSATDGRRLFAATSAAVYSSGRLLFVREGTLLAQTFDTERLAISGDPSPVAEQVLSNGERPAISASARGSVAYRAGTGGSRLWEFVWFDRSGRETGRVGSPDSRFGHSPSMSPDGRRVALLRVVVSGNADIWMLETDRGVLGRFTLSPSNDSFPIWSPDGTRVVFSSDRRGAGAYDLYQTPAPGFAGSETVLLTTPQRKEATDWSSDGKYLLYTSLDPRSGGDIWALPLSGEPKPFSVVATSFEERNGQFSPDGKWVAFESNKSGRSEIYVQPFPGPGGDAQVSTAGGAQVRWGKNGQELFYVALDERLMAVPIRDAGNGRSVDAGAPAALFLTRIGGAVQSAVRQQYMVSPDGQRFLLYTVTTEPTVLPITLILNWKPPSK